MMYCITILSNAQDNSKCSDILKEGIRDTYNFSNSEDFDSQFDSWINSQQFNNHVRNSANGFSLSLPIPDFPFTLGTTSSSDYINQFKNHYQTGLNIENKRIIRENLMHEVANSTIIDAWSLCMQGNNNSAGLKTFVDDDPNSLLINFGIRWVPSLNVNNAEILSIETEGGIISNACIDKDTFIGTEWIYCMFRKSALSQDIAINIQLKDNLGSKVILLRNTQEVQEVDDRSVLQKCFAGDLNACNQILNSSNIIDKTREIYTQNLEKCKSISSPIDNYTCTSEASAIYDRGLQDIGVFAQLINRVMDTYVRCQNSDNPNPSCKQDFAVMNDGIYRFVNNVPTEHNFIYSINFNF